MSDNSVGKNIPIFTEPPADTAPYMNTKEASYVEPTHLWTLFH